MTAADLPTLEIEARRMGREAYGRGLMRAPALNPAYMAWHLGLVLDGEKMGIGPTSCRLMAAYLRGWDRANIADDHNLRHHWGRREGLAP